MARRRSGDGQSPFRQRLDDSAMSFQPTPPSIRLPLRSQLRTLSLAPCVAATAPDCRADPVAQTTLALRDLRVTPSWLSLVLLACAVPLLTQGLSSNAWLPMAFGLALMGLLTACLAVGIETLRGLRLRVAPPSLCFAGDTAMLALSARNPSGRARSHIAVTLGEPSLPGGTRWLAVAARATDSVLMPLPAIRCGSQAIPRVRLETRHPFGLLRVRATWRPPGEWQVRTRPAPF
jgi:uncharacterized protein (DUF58 family)